jgi:hypothetical protein
MNLKNRCPDNSPGDTLIYTKRATLLRVPVVRRDKCALWVIRHKHTIVTASTVLYIVLQEQIIAQAQIFSPAQNAMKCIVNAANTGGGATFNSLFQQLPTLLFTAIEIVIFAYIIYSVVQAISASRQGEELTQVVQQPLITFIFMVIIVLFQSFLFGGGTTCA